MENIDWSFISSLVDFLGVSLGQGWNCQNMGNSKETVQSGLEISS